MFAFDSVWDRLARSGRCDKRGGAEYRRVYREWLQDGRTMAIEKFIRDRANQCAPKPMAKVKRKGGGK